MTSKKNMKKIIRGYTLFVDSLRSYYEILSDVQITGQHVLDFIVEYHTPKENKIKEESS